MCGSPSRTLNIPCKGELKPRSSVTWSVRVVHRFMIYRAWDHLDIELEHELYKEPRYSQHERAPTMNSDLPQGIHQENAAQRLNQVAITEGKMTDRVTLVGEWLHGSTFIWIRRRYELLLHVNTVTKTITIITSTITIITIAATTTCYTLPQFLSTLEYKKAQQMRKAILTSARLIENIAKITNISHSRAGG